ncbi:bacterial transferase hexapeptide repeat protein [Ralstonia pickettii]|nr:bacterial transferase hexapeptide repeat protein [Ralstonia pickettii]
MQGHTEPLSERSRLYMISDLVSEDIRVSIGKGTYASSPPIIRPHHANNRIVIGNYCCLAHDVTIFAGGNHPMGYLTMHPLKLYLGKGSFEDWSADCGDDAETTTIGNDVWIGHGATILSGVKIGDGAVIGAHTVVASDVPPYAIVAGNPAKLIRKRFSEPQIEQLLKLGWWNWPREHIEEAAEYLCSGDLDALLAFAGEKRGVSSPCSSIHQSAT